MSVQDQLLFRREKRSGMNGSMIDWLIMGIMFAGAPALVLARRWDAVAAGLTIPRECGPAPVEAPVPAPEPLAAPEPILEPAPAYLRLCRVDESSDAERRRRRHLGMVRAGF